MSTAPDTWIEWNQRALVLALAEVRYALERHAQMNSPAKTRPLQATPPDFDGALDTICTLFNLSPFERAVLVLCAAMELEHGFAALCAAAHGDETRPYPTFSLALAALPDAHWSALTPAAPLRYWRLIDVGAASTLTFSPLRIDERVLHYLTGVSYLDERLSGMIVPVRQAHALTPSQAAVVARVVGVWEEAHSSEQPPLIQLVADDAAAARSVAAYACTELNCGLHALAADTLPTHPAELDTLQRLWEREAVLSRSALLIDCYALDNADSARTGAVLRFIDRLRGAVIVCGRERLPAAQRPALMLHVPHPNLAEQRAVWHKALGDTATSLNGAVDELVAQFNLGTTAIAAAVAATPRAAADFGARLWDASRAQARPRMDDLAQRVEPGATWDDLVLPQAQRDLLHQVVVQVRQRMAVYERWGFASKSARGLGISALFAGGSGTGKTLAAEVLAQELRLDLYRIDLSQVVSKYIGETEKNLRRVFDAAQEGGAVLLFDEADALFGKRSEVKDSHDRYANIEISYLLQRMEAYRGLAILTTNMKTAIDTAFLRRIRFVVQFPFPDGVQRAAIWRQIFPGDAPTGELDVDKLARLNVAGGNIRNIALGAAFRAAEAGGSITMAHVAQAARAEYAKLDKPLTEAEIGGWEQDE